MKLLAAGTPSAAWGDWHWHPAREGVERVGWAAAWHNGCGKPTTTHSPDRRRRQHPARQSRWRWPRSAWRCTMMTCAAGRMEGVSCGGGWCGEMMAAQRALTGEDGGGARARDARRRPATLSCVWRMTPRHVVARWATLPDKQARCQPQHHWQVGCVAIVFQLENKCRNRIIYRKNG
jgi:hypothetical protein